MEKLHFIVNWGGGNLRKELGLEQTTLYTNLFQSFLIYKNFQYPHRGLLQKSSIS